MEPATADPSLLTDTATSDTTGSGGRVGSVVAVVVGSALVESVCYCTNLAVVLRVIVIYSPITSRVKESLTSGEVWPPKE